MCSPEIGELSLATEGYEHQQRVYRFGLHISKGFTGLVYCLQTLTPNL